MGDSCRHGSREARALCGCQVLHCTGLSPVHPGTRLIPVSPPVQWHLSQQVRYLPLTMQACTVAIGTLYWRLLQEVQIGDGRERDMWEARKWGREQCSPLGCYLSGEL